MRTRIKICGLTQETDIVAAVDAGADALGFVFYPKSKRCLTAEHARQLRSIVPAYVSVVALFVNPDSEDVRAVQDAVQPDLLQFHGDESVAQCQQYGQRYVKAFRVGAPGLSTAQEVRDSCAAYDDAAGWLFDSYTPQYGGSGETFDRGLLHLVQDTEHARPIILSGGLRSETVGDAIHQVRPWAVDVSSGVETAPGVKDTRAILAFVHAVNKADRS